MLVEGVEAFCVACSNASCIRREAISTLSEVQCGEIKEGVVRKAVAAEEPQDDRLLLDERPVVAAVTHEGEGDTVWEELDGKCRLGTLHLVLAEDIRTSLQPRIHTSGRDASTIGHMVEGDDQAVCVLEFQQVPDVVQ